MKISVLLVSVILITISCSQQNQQKRNTKNADLINQYFGHFNTHEWKKMAEMYTETAAFKDPSLGQGIITQTRGQTVQKYSQLNEVFPDLNDNVIQIYPSGEKHVLVEFVSSGTAVDGLTFELPICTIFTVENGKIIK